MIVSFVAGTVFGAVAMACAARIAIQNGTTPEEREAILKRVESNPKEAPDAQ